MSKLYAHEWFPYDAWLDTTVAINYYSRLHVSIYRIMSRYHLILLLYLICLLYILDFFYIIKICELNYKN